MFNTNISYQLFDYIINFMKSQHSNTTSKGNFVLKNQYYTLAFKISGIQNDKSDSDLVWQIQ